MRGNKAGNRIMGTKQNTWAARTSVLARSCVIAVASPRSTGPRFSPFLHHPAPLFHAQMHGLLVLVVFVILGCSSHNALLTCCAGVQKAFLPRPSASASDPVSAVFLQLTANSTSICLRICFVVFLSFWCVGIVYCR